MTLPRLLDPTPRTTGIAGLLMTIVLLACDGGAGELRPAVDSADAGRPPATDEAALSEALETATPGRLVDMAEEAYFSGSFERAGSLAEVARDRAERSDDRRAVARAEIWLAQVARQRGDLATGRQLAESSLRHVLDAGFEDLEPRAYSTLGFIAWYQNRLAEAGRLFERSLERARELGDQEGVSRAANNLAQIQTAWGEFEAAREGFETTRAVGRALGRAYDEATALVNLGMLDIELGDPLAAISKLEDARRLYVENGFADWEGFPLSHMGVAYMQLGELGRARAKLDSALRIDREHELAAEEAEELRVLAELHRQAGDDRRALELYADAARIEEDLGGVLQNGSDLRSVAEIHARVGDFAAAAARASEALRLHVESGARYEELLDRTVLAEVAFLRGRPEESTRHLAAGRALVDELEARAARVELALTEARIADAAGDPSGALRALAPISADLPRSRFAAQWEAARLAARAHLRGSRLDSALVAARRAVSMLERVRGNLGPGVMRTAITGSGGGTYADLVAILLRLGRDTEAFDVSDRARGQGARDHLTAAHVSPVDAVAGSAAEGERLLRRIDRLIESLDSLETIPRDERDSTFRASASDLERRLAASRTEYEAYLERAKDPAAALLGTSSVPLERVRRALEPGETLVEYLVAPDRLIIFALDRARLHVVEAEEDADDLVSRVRLALGLLRDPETAAGPATNAVLERLHGLLMEPVARSGALADAKRLVLVPHGALTYLPFAALRDSLTGRYLGQDFVLLNAPSAGALAVLRERGAGQPDAAGRSTRAPATGSPDRARANPARVPIRAFAPFPHLLPATEQEARTLARSSDAQASVGEEASEVAVRRALGRSGVVHLATHGVMNARNPMFSRIELARDGDDPAADGRLEVHEVLGLPVRASLVFLSGCETGRGSAWSTDLAPGEDYATLDRAFLYSGARNVVATLWRVDDRGAAIFAEAFYEALRTDDPADALAAAQRRLQAAGGERASPFYWAAYRVSGTGS